MVHHEIDFRAGHFPQRFLPHLRAQKNLQESQRAYPWLGISNDADHG